MDARARGDGREENQWGGEIEVVIAWQTCLEGKKRRLYAGAGSRKTKTKPAKKRDENSLCLPRDS